MCEVSPGEHSTVSTVELELDMVGYILAGAIALMLVWVGVAAAWRPRGLAWSYGVRTTDAAGIVYVRATGARDLVLGLMIGFIMARHATAILAGVLAIGSAIAAADLALVLREPGARRRAGFIHGGGIILLLAASACLTMGW